MLNIIIWKYFSYIEKKCGDATFEYSALRNDVSKYQPLGNA